MGEGGRLEGLKDTGTKQNQSYDTANQFQVNFWKEVYTAVVKVWPHIQKRNNVHRFGHKHTILPL